MAAALSNVLRGLVFSLDGSDAVYEEAHRLEFCSLSERERGFVALDDCRSHYRDVLMRCRRWPDAISLMVQAVRDDVANTKGLAQVYLKLGQLDKCDTFFRRYLQHCQRRRDDDNDDERVAEAEQYVDEITSMRRLRQRIDASPSVELLLELAASLKEADAVDAALAIYTHEAPRVAKVAGDALALSLCLQAAGDTFDEQGDVKLAADYYWQAATAMLQLDTGHERRAELLQVSHASPCSPTVSELCVCLCAFCVAGPRALPVGARRQGGGTEVAPGHA